MSLPGEWPGVIKSYDADLREVRVDIPGMTDGAEEFPVAQIRYPIGDKSKHTEIEILEGDLVWLAFECGDPRYPIITGWRNPSEGNVVGFRRWHHKNIESDADETQKHTAGTSYTVKAESVLIDGTKTVTIKSEAILLDASQTVTIKGGSKVLLEVGGSQFELSSGGIKQVSSANTMQGPLTQTGGDITSDGKSVQFHVHIEQGDGKPVSPPV